MIKKTLAISIAHLYKSYPSVKAVQDLSFEIPTATCFTILGPNGAGKTTAIKTIYGKALTDTHKETRMSVFGHDPRKNELAIKALTGVVQQENNLDYELNVEQNLFIYARFYGLPKKQASARIDELLEFMELKDRRTSSARSLSGGMQRRLIIARALINDPRLLILDEPTTGLDLQVRDLIWDRLNKLKQRGVTILLTTHYMEEAYELSDNIMIMHKGRRILHGTPDHLLSKEIEPHVLIISDVSGNKENKPLAGVRFERIGDRGFFYAAESDLLKKQAEKLQTQSYSMRNTNLGDVFMRATGGTLGEQQ